MKILEQTPTQLILQRQPGGLSWFTLVILWIFGGLLLTTAIVIALANGLRSLSCQRIEATQVDCELIEKNLFGIPVQTTSLSSLQETTLTTHSGSDTTYYEVVLYGRTNQISFGTTGNFTSQQAIAQQLNEFVQKPNLSVITLHRDDRFSQGLVSVGCLLAGSGLILLGINLQEKATYIFDKQKNSLTLNRQTLFQNQTKNYPLDELNQAYLYDNEGHLTVFLKFQTKPNKIQLTNSTYTYSGETQQKLIDTINQFINYNK